MCRALEKDVAGYYQYRDRLGSSVIEANEQGQVISYEEYYPYGASAYRASSSSADLSLKRYRFTGKERDNETGLDYFGVRYYASWLGRWTSGDPGGFVDGLNLYWYARNNPVNGIDQEGYSTEVVETELPPIEIEVSKEDNVKNNLPPDWIFYNQDGEEIRRIKQDGEHKYFLHHDEGTIKIDGENYYEGNSYWSFFGDPGSFPDGNVLFTQVDSTSFPTLSVDVLNELVNLAHDGEWYRTIWLNSGGSQQFDYKNNVFFNDPETGGNQTTAYLIDDKLYNRNEMGMFLWGGAIGRTDVKYSQLTHWNKSLHLYIESSPDEWNEIKTWTAGYYMTKYGEYNEENVKSLRDYYVYGINFPYNVPLRGGDPTFGGINIETERRAPNLRGQSLNWFDMGLLFVLNRGIAHTNDETIFNRREAYEKGR